MGTRYAISVAGVDEAKADAAMTLAFAEVDRIEKLMSEWLPDSEISLVNRTAGRQAIQVSPDTFEVVRIGFEVSAESQGAFDITWAAMRDVWDFKNPLVPPTAAVEDRLKSVGFRYVVLDPVKRTVFLRRPRMAIGLGGIAKGYAIDRASEILRRAGIDGFIVDGGGDLYVSGEKAPGVPWMLGVQHPRMPGSLIGVMPLRDTSVVTSGDYERFFEVDGRRYHHIIDLSTGYPATKSISVTVQAKNATIADAMSTAIFVLGPRDGLAFARKMGVEAAVVDPQCHVHATEGLKAVFGETCKVLTPTP